MRLRPIRLRSLAHEAGGPELEAVADATSAGTADLGPLAVTWSGDERTVAWRVANRGDRPVAVRSVALVYEVEAAPPIRMFRHGYQSWSPTGVATLGVDVDPSTIADLELLQAAHHADQRRALDGELRAELVTVLADASGAPTVLLGFDGGTRARRDVPPAPDRQRRSRAPRRGVPRRRGLRARRGAGAARRRHRRRRGTGERQAGRLGRPRRHRRTAPARRPRSRSVGAAGTSTSPRSPRTTLRSNLALAADWPFEVFQLDDGSQANIGDWLRTNDTFPSDLDAIADAIRAAGRTPGIWLAPFLAAADSDLAAEHPGWLAPLPAGRRGPRRAPRGGTRHGPTPMPASSVASTPRTPRCSPTSKPPLPHSSTPASTT